MVDRQRCDLAQNHRVNLYIVVIAGNLVIPLIEGADRNVVPGYEPPPNKLSHNRCKPCKPVVRLCNRTGTCECSRQLQPPGSSERVQSPALEEPKAGFSQGSLTPPLHATEMVPKSGVRIDADGKQLPGLVCESVFVSFTTNCEVKFTQRLLLRISQ